MELINTLLTVLKHQSSAMIVIYRVPSTHVQPESSTFRMANCGSSLRARKAPETTYELRLLSLVDPYLSEEQILEALLISMDNKLGSGVGNASVDYYTP
jgi:hypothetical protein